MESSFHPSAAPSSGQLWIWDGSGMDLGWIWGWMILALCRIRAWMVQGQAGAASWKKRCGKMGISVHAPSVMLGKELKGAAAASSPWECRSRADVGKCRELAEVYRRFCSAQSGLKDDKCSGVRQPGDTWNSKKLLGIFRSLSFNL